MKTKLNNDLYYLGIDLGSISIKYAILNSNGNVIDYNWYRSYGDVVGSLQKMLEHIKIDRVNGIVTTGSARKFGKHVINADASIDEITAHRIAIKKMYPSVKTIFEIGGQDSKLIYYGQNTINFEMNNACAAGTGSFLDQQASRLKYDIVSFFKKGLFAQEAYNIASKCTVFAESDMIHAQQSGVPIDLVIRGVHRGLVQNFFNKLCSGKSLSKDFLFEGGTSENDLLVDEFRKHLLKHKHISSPEELIVPKPYNMVIGAIGCALYAINKGIVNNRNKPIINDFEYLSSKTCNSCQNHCGALITRVKINNKILEIGRSCQ